MCHISLREDYKMDKQILFSSNQFLPGGHASGSLKGLFAFVAGTKGAVAAFSPLTVYNAMYAGQHLTGRYCLSLSHLFISFCRKCECKAFHYVLVSRFRQWQSPRHLLQHGACSPSELLKKFCLTQPGSLPIAI